MMLNDNAEVIDVSRHSPSDKNMGADSTVIPTKDVNTFSKKEASVRFATSGSYVARPNQVTTVMLHGVPIVCLYIDGKERLCLAQISNTLLKQYSYNEIHNRRVALGITCVQCTPVQLEILRRAGAMPISSRRCGMITMREAQRLVKSFLEDNIPPKLPDNFSFHVKHLCGWGCEGHFEPSRYNSSRAKCIKCTLCNMYFSPNKFIFHFHRTPESKYNHPDAANFNSWRRHLHLVSGTTDNETISHAWEDVKAMFNGGSRKRIMSNSKTNTYDVSISECSLTKKTRISPPEYSVSDTMYPSPYTAFSLLSQPRKQFQFSQMNHGHPLGFSLPFNKECPQESPKASPLQNPSWAGLHSVIPAYNFLWNNPFSHDYRSPMRSPVFPLRESAGKTLIDPNENYPDEDSSSSAGNSPTYDEKNERFSAFRLVSQMKHTDEKSNVSDQNDDNEEINIVDESNETTISKTADSPITDTQEQQSNNESHCTSCVDKMKYSIQKVLENTEHKVLKTPFSLDMKGKVKVHTEHNDQNVVEEKIGVSTLSKEEIQNQIKVELEIRKKMENEIQTLKDSLTNELEQERQVRFSLQQKLKEAHDALHNFSCKMLASRQCDECTYKDEEIEESEALTE